MVNCINVKKYITFVKYPNRILIISKIGATKFVKWHCKMQAINILMDDPSGSMNKLFTFI
jgi:hypothetical protein